MSVTRLSGGLTPGVGGDPRTFPAIWNATADVIDAQGTAISDLEDLNPVQFGTAVASGGQVLAFSTAVSGYVPEDVFGGAVNGTAVYRFVDTLYFTSSGTFTKADYPWLRAIRVKVQGAGGAGAGGAATTAGNTSIAGGGGGGGYAESFITDIAGLAASVTVTRGAGGTGVSGAAGNGGGDSSFGATVIGRGGPGGTRENSIAIFLMNLAREGGGVTFANVGDFIVTGGAGGQAFVLAHTDFQATGGAGGSSVLGSGALAARADRATAPSGNLYGGGGGGHTATNGQSARTGGAGANGIVIVELYA